MTELKALFLEQGFKNVQTYIQSGNIVFQFKETAVEEVQRLIYKAIQTQFGFEVPNLVLLPKEIEEALQNNPFQNIEKMYFTFLSKKPKPEHIDHLKTFNFENEYYELKGKVIYSHFPKGAGRAKMTNNFFENKLKVMATSRNLNTTKKLYEMTKSTL